MNNPEQFPREAREEQASFVSTVTAPMIIMAWHERKHRMVSVAHEILNAHPEDEIQFLNGDVLDLRNNNLKNLGRRKSNQKRDPRGFLVQKQKGSAGGGVRGR